MRDMIKMIVVLTVLSSFSGGLLAFIGIKVLAPGYFARQDTKTPVKVGMVALVVNLVLNLTFVYALIKMDVTATHAGLALATTVAAFVNAGLLWLGLRRAGLIEAMPGWGLFFVRIVIAAGAMTALLMWGSPALGWWLEVGAWQRVGRLALLVIGGAALYFAVLAASGLRPSHLRMGDTGKRAPN